MNAINNPFMSPYRPRGLTDGSIPAAYASYLGRNPDLKLSYVNGYGQTTSPRTPAPMEVVPEIETQTAAPLSSPQ